MFLLFVAISIISLLDIWESLVLPVWLNYVVLVLAVIGLIMAATSKKKEAPVSPPVQQ